MFNMLPSQTSMEMEAVSMAIANLQRQLLLSELYKMGMVDETTYKEYLSNVWKILSGTKAE